MSIGSVLREIVTGRTIEEEKAVVERIFQIETLADALEQSARVEKIPPILFQDVIDKKIVLRASNFAKKCMRQEALCAIHNVEREMDVSSRLSLIFDVGHAVHDMLREKYFGPTGLLWAQVWLCKGCGHSSGESDHRYHVMPAICPACKGTEFRYTETYVKNEDYMIGGHVDGFVGRKEPEAILEIKTANSNYFRRQLRFQAAQAHIMQVQIYLWLTGLRTAYLLYFDKDTSETKIFDIAYSPSIIESVKKAIQELKICMEKEGKKVPKRVVCSGTTDKMAKECPVVDLCFRKREKKNAGNGA